MAVTDIAVLLLTATVHHGGYKTAVLPRCEYLYFIYILY